MRKNRKELFIQYESILREISKVKNQLSLEALRKENLERKRKIQFEEKAANGTLSISDYFIFEFDSSLHFYRELSYLLEKAQSLSKELWGEDGAFIVISDFLLKFLKRILKVLKYLINSEFRNYENLEDKRLFIVQFRKLLIRIKHDDVDNFNSIYLNLYLVKILNSKIIHNEYIKKKDILLYTKEHYKCFDL